MATEQKDIVTRTVTFHNGLACRPSQYCVKPKGPHFTVPLRRSRVAAAEQLLSCGILLNYTGAQCVTQQPKLSRTPRRNKNQPTALPSQGHWALPWLMNKPNVFLQGQPGDTNSSGWAGMTQVAVLGTC